MGMMTTLTTPRLILKPLDIKDADAIQEKFPHWDIVKYLVTRIPWPYPDNGALNFLNEVALPSMKRGEHWYWTLRPKIKPKNVIGVINLMEGEEENRGFWLDVAWQGKGLMTEASEAVTDYWFLTLGKPRLRVTKASNNFASKRISERNGMKIIATKGKEYLCGWSIEETWEITREEWLKRKPR